MFSNSNFTPSPFTGEGDGGLDHREALPLHGEAGLGSGGEGLHGTFARRPLGYRKKTCTGCGQYLYLGRFYRLGKSRNHPDGYDCRCKECRRKAASKREQNKLACYAEREQARHRQGEERGIRKDTQGARWHTPWCPRASRGETRQLIKTLSPALSR